MSMLSPVSKSAFRKGGVENLAWLPALSFPKLFVEVGNGTSEVFLVHGVPGSHHVPASRNIAEEFGLLRHHVLFRAIAMFLVDGERRRVPLGKYRGKVPEEEELVGCRGRSRGGISEGREAAVLRNVT